MAFVMVLSFSRRVFLRFFLDARMENFLHGHLGAFAAWDGVPRVILYDNLRSAVLERHGDAIRFTRLCSTSPDTIVTNPDPSRWPAATKKGGWKGP